MNKRIAIAALLFFLANNSWSNNLVVCFDGTGQDGTQLEKPSETDPSETIDARAIGTNVWILCGEDGLLSNSTTTVNYFPGVGSKEFLWFDEKGEATGWGAASIRDEAISFVKKHFSKDRGDKLFVFGYSRGAAIARDFVNSQDIDTVTFLGLWDTVGAFGIPTSFFGLDTQRINLLKRLEIPLDKVEQTVHAVAIDEKREPFYPTLVKAAENVEEVWFSGVHSDVGGGNAERGLSNIALGFIVDRAKEAGLNIDVTRLTTEYPTNPDTDLHVNKKMKEKLRIISVQSEDNRLKPKVHNSVYSRMGTRAGYKPFDKDDRNIHRWPGEN